MHTIVIGAGQSGLSASYYLKALGVEHLVLEKSRIGDSWRRRWDSFTLVTPNVLNALPDFPSGGEPDAFLTRAEVIDYLERFAATFDPPLRLGVRVLKVQPRSPGGFLVSAEGSAYRCENVVVATNIFQQARLPAFAGELPSSVLQLHSDQYRNPAALRDGPVLVVGSAQSGCQIAYELHTEGRKVYLSVSRAGRMPRRYRDRDMMDWLRLFRAFEQTVDELDTPQERLAARPHVTGRDGGKTLNLRRFGAEGMVLCGKIDRVSGGRIFFAPDLAENLAGADRYAAELCGAIDAAVEKLGLDVPPPTDEELVPESWEPGELLRELSVGEAGIQTVIWATGYPFDFGWVEGIDFDEIGYPVHERGVTGLPGLYFLGLPWLYKQKSASLYGAAEDAGYVAQHIAERSRDA